ncbi:hypothetical protein D6D29_08377 [Aureobasidium pullulans]|nr:hypothetical protein D6D29_08377 [Aureobasidium pullulans]
MTNGTPSWLQLPASAAISIRHVHEADHNALEYGGRKLIGVVCQRSLEADLLRKRARRLLSRTIQKFARKEKFHLAICHYERTSTLILLRSKNRFLFDR